LLDCVEHDVEFPFKLGPWIIDDAPEIYTNSIREFLQKHIPIGMFNSLPYQEYVQGSEGVKVYSDLFKGSGYLIIHSDEYDVFEMYGNNKTVFKKTKNVLRLESALRLSDDDLWSALSIRNVGGLKMTLYDPRSLNEYYHQNRVIPLPKIVDWNSLKEIVELLQQFEEDQFPEIKRALDLFMDNEIVPIESPLRNLGYFAVIESILSHAPSPNDSADSISRQLKRNLILLNNRMGENQNLQFGRFNTNPETVISKLYSYRSAIAHGSSGSLEINKFNQLVRDEKEFKFKGRVIEKNVLPHYLRRITKRLLVHAVREPQLVTDLK